MNNESKEYYKKKIKSLKWGIACLIFTIILIVFAALIVLFASDKPILAIVFAYLLAHSCYGLENAISTKKQYEKEIKKYETNS